jgi:hypothetical protein
MQKKKHGGRRANAGRRRSADADIASFWGISDRTFRRWKSDGAPIHDEKAMQAWLATRKNLPHSVLEKLKLPTVAGGVSILVGRGTSGAGAALKRLQEAELAAFERLQVAIAGGNPLLIKEAREGWTKLCESLRKYELLVEASRREAGELIPRVELQKFVTHFYSFGKSALRGQAEDLVNSFMGKSELEIYERLRDVLNRNLFDTVLSWMRGCADQRLIESGRKFLQAAYVMTDEQIDSWLREWK